MIATALIYLAVLNVIRASPEPPSAVVVAKPVSHCFDQCAEQYFPEIMVKSYKACRHGCRFAQYSRLADLPADLSPPYHQCYSYCHNYYKDDLAEQEACVFSCRTSYHTDVVAAVGAAGHAHLPLILHNHTVSSKCLSQLYETLEGPRCLAYIQMWQFNYNTFKCEEFIFGGCPEIANMFESKEICEKECGSLAKLHFGHHHQAAAVKSPLIQGAAPPRCLAPTYSLYLKLGGLECDNYVERFQFNYEDGVCESFRYGGCIDVPNMWETLEACQAECAFFTAPPTTTTTTTPEPPTTIAPVIEAEVLDPHRHDNKAKNDGIANSAVVLKKSIINMFIMAYTVIVITIFAT